MELIQRFERGDRRALARLLSHAARGESIPELRAALAGRTRIARVVALTGGPGVGKSSLLGKLVEHLRGEGLRVAVLACDPESPITHGALLGDRIRMSALNEDPGVFIRSVAARGDQQALAEHLDLMIELFDRFGFEVIVIETVGAGQGDTAVRDLADVVVLLVQPEAGDDLQWEKAGVFEVADVIAVNKSDLPRAEQVVADIRAQTALAGETAIPVVPTSAHKPAGLAELWTAIQSVPQRQRGDRRDPRGLLRLAQDQLVQRFNLRGAEIDAILARWQAGETNDAMAAKVLLRAASEPELAGLTGRTSIPPTHESRRDEPGGSNTSQTR